MGISLAFLKYVDYGTDPYSFMNFAIAHRIGWSLGNWQLTINILMFIPVLLWGRDQIGPGTVFNMVLIGYTVDLTMWLLELANFPALMASMTIKLIVMFLALVVFLLSAATYMSSGMGTSPFDAICVMIAHKLPKLPFKLVRFFYDLLAVLIGMLFGGKLGIVTALMVAFLGISVEFAAAKLFKRKM